MTEYELDPLTMKRTGRTRNRQFYRQPGVLHDKRPISQRTSMEFRSKR